MSVTSPVPSFFACGSERSVVHHWLIAGLPISGKCPFAWRLIGRDQSRLGFFSLVVNEPHQAAASACCWVPVLRHVDQFSTERRPQIYNKINKVKQDEERGQDLIGCQS
jgi:hypothetical protein